MNTELNLRITNKASLRSMKVCEDRKINITEHQWENKEFDKFNSINSTQSLLLVLLLLLSHRKFTSN